MRLAILITNTDFSDFSKARPHDGEKFADLIAEVRPGWNCEWFWTCRNEFPTDIAKFDGVILTGSPASVHEDEPWIARLEALIKQIIDARIPMFGACFGHQLIAKTLGAEIIRNPNGWGHGRLGVERVDRLPWAADLPQHLSLYGSHNEQVAALPKGARLIFRGKGCDIAGFALGDHVLTIQHHPEMTYEFIFDLVQHYADYVGPEVTASAMETLQQPANRAEFAKEIARFFEYGTRRTP